MTQYNQAKYLKKLKSNASMLLMLCNKPMYKSPALQTLRRDQHTALVLRFSNALLKIVGIGEQGSWDLAQSILRELFPYIEGKFSDSITKGRREYIQ